MQWRCRGRGNKILVGTVMKAKISELEDELKESFLRRMRKEFIGVVQGFYFKRRFFVKFQDGCEKNMNPNQLTAVTV